MPQGQLKHIQELKKKHGIDYDSHAELWLHREAKNGARPNAELLKKIIRCKKGEKPAAKGFDGAVTVDVAALQVEWQSGSEEPVKSPEVRSVPRG